MSTDIGFTIDQMEVGMSRSYAKTLTETDIVLFAAASGDVNSVHLNQEYAEKTPFGGRIAHGILTAGVISACIANRLPGAGTIYLGQTLKFMAPVRPGDRVTATVTVTAMDIARRRVTLDCACRVGDRVVLKGEALVLAPSRKFD